MCARRRSQHRHKFSLHCETNGSGEYGLANLPPGTCRIRNRKIDFKKLIKADAVLQLRDALEINLQMTLGSALETITVEAGAPLVNTQSVAVRTVIDRTFNPLYQVGGPRSVQLALKLQF